MDFCTNHAATVPISGTRGGGGGGEGKHANLTQGYIAHAKLNTGLNRVSAGPVSLFSPQDIPLC